ncbi:UNVERIFIED_CONTAM: hypothetical protein FKN15_031589 [Acipenser sinensis]
MPVHGCLYNASPRLSPLCQCTRSFILVLRLKTSSAALVIPIPALRGGTQLLQLSVQHNARVTALNATQCEGHGSQCNTMRGSRLSMQHNARVTALSATQCEGHGSQCNTMRGSRLSMQHNARVTALNATQCEGHGSQCNTM